MSYTLLRVIDAGVVLFEHHRRRFERAGVAAASAFDDFAWSTAPGIYALKWRGSTLDVAQRPESRLRDGMPTRLVPSPLAANAVMLAKPPSPSAYDSVRADGVATLLTSPDGAEIYESCSAAVVSWRNGSFLLVPSDRPRVASTTERWLAEAAPCREEPLLVESSMPLALINAVKGACLVDVPGRAPLPELAREMIETMLPVTARRI
jgi:hypothetical protein